MPRLAGDPDVVYPASVLQAERPRLSSLELVDLMLKGACVVLNLILADGPLALLSGGMEVVRLFMQVVRRFMEVVGWQSAWRRDARWQEHSPLASILPGRASAVDVPGPFAWGRTGRYA